MLYIFQFIIYIFYFAPNQIQCICLYCWQTKKGKGEDLRRKVNILLLSGQRLELTCDTKSICKDVFDMVVAQIGLVEHHLFGLAYLKGSLFIELLSISDGF